MNWNLIAITITINKINYMRWGKAVEKILIREYYSYFWQEGVKRYSVHWDRNKEKCKFKYLLAKIRNNTVCLFTTTIVTLPCLVVSCSTLIAHTLLTVCLLLGYCAVFPAGWHHKRKWWVKFIIIITITTVFLSCFVFQLKKPCNGTNYRVIIIEQTRTFERNEMKLNEWRHEGMKDEQQQRSKSKVIIININFISENWSLELKSS